MNELDIFYRFSQVTLFLLGLAAGSFVNALVYRLYSGHSLLGYSFCPNCRHRIHPKDLVPVLSFLLLRGRCRHCHKPISWQYPAVEVAGGVMFLLIFQIFSGLNQATGINLIFACLTATLLLAIFVFDLLYYLIPDILVIAGVAIAVLWRLFSPGHDFIQALWGALSVGGFFLLLYLVSKGRWIGLGDVKLGVFLGLVLPWPMSLVMLGLAYFSGAIVGVGLVLLQKKKMSGILPFGTFLTAATFATLLWGQALSDWFLKTLYF